MMIATDTAIIAYAENKLWGISGGQLEYVSQRIEWRKSSSGKHSKVMVIRFTDHDLQAYALKDHKELIDGQYYELEFPLEG